MNSFKRADRVSELIRREISLIIEHDLKDNRIAMATVTEVEMSKDMKNAKVFVSVLGDDEAVKRTISVLNSAAGFIKSRLGEKVILRYIPNLSFRYDPSTVYGMKIDKILDEIRDEGNK
jgi:ribosome-binding factor A